MVNSLTGRGHLGKLEPAAKVINNVLFSPRFVKSNIDTFLHPISGAGGSAFVRKQAALNLLKVVAGSATVLVAAKALKPDSVEPDPRSSDFGKIRVGDTRFDVTGGIASLATLAARLATNSTKSSTTKEVRGLGERTESGAPKFGAPTRLDTVYNFFENKLSPAGSVIRDVLKGQDRERNPPTVGSELRNLFEPLPVSNYRELKNNPNSAPMLAAMLADALGISTNTYSGGARLFSQPNFIGNELERLRFKQGEVYKPVGLPEIDNRARELMAGILSQQADALEHNLGYKQATDPRKALILRERLRDARKDARKTAEDEHPELEEKLRQMRQSQRDKDAGILEEGGSRRSPFSSPAGLDRPPPPPSP